MEKLKAKLKKRGGFTMVELLIVVAIIAILVAVSIPMMNSALERSRHAVDQANVRDAIGLISVKYTTDPDSFKGTGAVTKYAYCVNKDTHQGYLSTTEVGVTPACTCDSCSTRTLEVELTPPTDLTKDAPEIKTSWKFDDSTDKTIDGDVTPSITAP